MGYPTEDFLLSRVENPLCYLCMCLSMYMCALLGSAGSVARSKRCKPDENIARWQKQACDALSLQSHSFSFCLGSGAGIMLLLVVCGCLVFVTLLTGTWASLLVLSALLILQEKSQHVATTKDNGSKYSKKRKSKR